MPPKTALPPIAAPRAHLYMPQQGRRGVRSRMDEASPGPYVDQCKRPPVPCPNAKGRGG